MDMKALEAFDRITNLIFQTRKTIVVTPTRDEINALYDALAQASVMEDIAEVRYALACHAAETQQKAA